MKGHREKRINGPLPMGAFVQKLTRSTLLRRGIHRHQILLDWHTIVGEKLSSLSCPLRITRPKDVQSGGTLHLQVLSGASLLIDSSKDLVLERINQYYGYQVVSRLKILQTPSLRGALPRPVPAKKLPKEKADVILTPALQKALEGISDPDLKKALTEFSHTFQAKKNT